MLNDPAFLATFLGLLVGLVLSAVIAILTVRYQERAKDGTVKRNTFRFLRSTIENTIQSVDLLLAQWAAGREIYFDLVDLLKEESALYLRHRENLFMMGETNVEREVESYFRRIRLNVSRAASRQSAIYTTNSNEQTNDEEKKKKVEDLIFLIQENINELRSLNALDA